MTDPRGNVSIALATMQARAVIRGIDLSDYRRLADKVTTWDDWWDQWTAMGEHYLALADRYQAEGWTASAGRARVRAGVAFHFGKSLAVEDDARYRDLTVRSVEAVAARAPPDGPHLRADRGPLRRAPGRRQPPPPRRDRAPAAGAAHPGHRVGQGGVPPVGGGLPQPRDRHAHHGRPRPGRGRLRAADPARLREAGHRAARRPGRPGRPRPHPDRGGRGQPRRLLRHPRGRVRAADHRGAGQLRPVEPRRRVVAAGAPVPREVRLEPRRRQRGTSPGSGPS